jgi:hypothetical protein
VSTCSSVLRPTLSRNKLKILNPSNSKI